MKKILRVVALAALAGFSAPALAADIPTKAPAYVGKGPVTANNWTGCYVGGNAGYAWNNSKSRYTDDPNTPNFDTDPINAVGTNVPNPGVRAAGWLGGGQIGCNRQNGQFVFGIEGDFDAVGLSKSGTSVAGPAQFGTAHSTFTLVNSFGQANEQVSQHWLSTVRARVGMTVNERLLIYGSGGLAIGAVSTSGSITLINDGFGISQVWSGAGSATKVGYAVGGGAEYAFADHWSWKVEYLYYDLGTIRHPLLLTFDTFAGSYPTLANTSSRINGNIVRVGLNYKFGGPVY